MTGETILSCGGLANTFQAHPRGSCQTVPRLDKHTVPLLDKFISGVDESGLAELADRSRVLQKLPCHPPSPLHKFNKALDEAGRTQTLEPARPELKFGLTHQPWGCVALGASLHHSEPRDPSPPAWGESFQPCKVTLST